MSTANAAAYATLLKTVHAAFVGHYGAGAPKILASYDGGSSGSTTWGQEVWASDPNNIASYVDGVTVHPYGGTGNAAQSAQGNRAGVTAAHTDTGKPVWITEVGWPTAVSQPATGDSLQWTELEQAQNIFNFVTWSATTGYVAAVTIFGYRDYGTNDWYGVERYGQGGSTVDGSKKPGWTALVEAAAGQACTVCQ
jgi:exo-beta-1,3-glucanase (GH17 family)